MVLDASAVLAIFQEEPGHERLLGRIGEAELVIVGAPTVLEAAIVLVARFPGDARARLMGLLRSMDAEIVEFTQEHFDVALDAFVRFGKGRHPAKLNFGDCMAYAIASISGFPLLYTGNDFSKTDIPAA